MVESDRTTETKQVVFVVDTTAGLSPYWDVIKRNYIYPAVVHFSGTQNPQIGQISTTLFSLIVYGSGDTFGGPYHSIRETVSTFMPKAFVKFIEQIELCGGGIDQSSTLTDALSVAFTILTYNDKILSENKHAIIVTNSEYYSTPVQTFNNFYNQSMDQLMDNAFQHGFNLSVIAPRRINSLRSLFVKASGARGATSIGGAVDHQHMVLTLFPLPDQPDAPNEPQPIENPNPQNPPNPTNPPAAEPTEPTNTETPTEPRKEPTAATPATATSRKVWEGHLLWRDNMQPEQKSIQCEISCSREQPGVAINAQAWPDQLFVKFIPQNLLQKLKEFFTNSIWMTFNFSQFSTSGSVEKNALYSLYEQLTKDSCIPI